MIDAPAKKAVLPVKVTVTSVVRVTLLVLIHGGCSEIDYPITEEAFSVLTYNLAGLNGEQHQAYLRSVNADFLALQESQNLDELPGYSIARSEVSGVSLLFNRSRWSTLECSQKIIGNNDDGWENAT